MEELNTFRKYLNENQNQFQVVFYGNGEEAKYSQIFNSKRESISFANGQEWDEQVEVYKDGDYRYETKYHYHNPEDEENYNEYEIIELS